MSPRPRLWIARAVPLLLLLAGCHAVLEPTAEERRSSFETVKRTIYVDCGPVVSATCLVIGAAEGAAPPLVDRVTGTITLPKAPAGTYSQGLGFSIHPFGYLLTARHVLRPTTYVVGWTGGFPTLHRARVVAEGVDLGEDVSLLSIDAPLDFWIPIGPTPDLGDPVIAAVCNRGKAEVGGQIEMAAGTLCDAGRPGRLVGSDVPLWYGDSGGPLLRQEGSAFGVNSALRFSYRRGTYVRISSLINVERVRKAEQDDIASVSRKMRGR